MSTIILDDNFKSKWKSMLIFLIGFCLGALFSFMFMFTPSKFHVSDYVKITQGAGKGCEGVIKKFEQHRLIKVFVIECPFPTGKKFVDFPEEYLEIKND